MFTKDKRVEKLEKDVQELKESLSYLRGKIDYMSTLNTITTIGITISALAIVIKLFSN